MTTVSLMVKCPHCGCYRDPSIPKRNLGGIDIADLVDAVLSLEELRAEMRAEFPHDVRVRDWQMIVDRVVKRLRASGQVL